MFASYPMNLGALPLEYSWLTALIWLIHRADCLAGCTLLLRGTLHSWCHSFPNCIFLEKCTMLASTALPTETDNAYMNCPSYQNYDTKWKFNCNSFCTRDKAFWRIYPHALSKSTYAPTTSIRLNHSCTPNAQQTHVPSSGQEVLYASRDIQIGVCVRVCLCICIGVRVCVRVRV